MDAFAMLDLDAIARTCKRYGVQRLRIFGSALTDDFDADGSDIDLLVDLAPGNTDLFHDNFDLKFDAPLGWARLEHGVGLVCPGGRP